MEVTQILHMNKGDGETSYAKNSTIQRKTLSIVKPIIEEAVLELIMSSNVKGIESMGIADLGCSSGPNTLLLITQVMDIMRGAQPSTITELRVYLNDLFSNDFNTIFMSLPEFFNKLKQDYCGGGHDPNGLQHPMNPFIAAVPGSFYGPLFPRKSLHFVHSCFSLHWLSQVPAGLNNKGNIYISESSPQSVLDAYSTQFQKDFTVFLRSRAQEIVEGGRMVLSFLGRPSSDPTAARNTFDQWELLAHALMAMVVKGRIEEEKVNSFNVPYYASCAEELNLVLQKEGSFITDRLETLEIDGGDRLDEDSTAFDDDQMITSSGQRVANGIRVVLESLLQSHFGKEIMDDLFRTYAQLLSKQLRNTTTVLVISLIKKNLIST